MNEAHKPQTVMLICDHQEEIQCCVSLWVYITVFLSHFGSILKLVFFSQNNKFRLPVTIPHLLCPLYHLCPNGATPTDKISKKYINKYTLDDRGIINLRRKSLTSLKIYEASHSKAGRKIVKQPYIV